MKKTLILALAVISFQTAFADNRIPGNGPGGRMDLPQCIKTLESSNRRINELQSQLIQCQTANKPGHGGREVEELRRENRRLNETVDRLNSDNRSLSESISRLGYDNNVLVNQNNNLLRENMDLRRQLDDLQGGNRNLGFFSYAGCKDYTGNVDTKLVKSGMGRNATEAQYNAMKEVTKNYSCSFGVKVQACQ